MPTDPPTDAEIGEAMRDRANWPNAAKAAIHGAPRKWNLAILVATLRKQAARIAELEQQVSVGYESIAMMSGKLRTMKDRILALEAEVERLSIVKLEPFVYVNRHGVRVDPPTVGITIHPPAVADLRPDPAVSESVAGPED